MTIHFPVLSDQRLWQWSVWQYSDSTSQRIHWCLIVWHHGTSASLPCALSLIWFWWFENKLKRKCPKCMNLIVYGYLQWCMWVVSFFNYKKAVVITPRTVLLCRTNCRAHQKCVNCSLRASDRDVRRKGWLNRDCSVRAVIENVNEDGLIVKCVPGCFTLTPHLWFNILNSLF